MDPSGSARGDRSGRPFPVSRQDVALLIGVINSVMLLVLLVLVLRDKPRPAPGPAPLSTPGPKTREESSSLPRAPAATGSPAAGKVTDAGPEAGEPEAPPPEITIDLGEGVALELVYVKPGKFWMGSTVGRDDEAAVHEVTISYGFYMGKYEVTQEQYQLLMREDRSRFKGPKNPVNMVNWKEAVRFCSELSVRAGRHFRLPTEAEWEYACRAGSEAEYCFGSVESVLDEYAWYFGNSAVGGDPKRQAHPVGQKRPNAWGLYDMHGNVWEWCHDWYQKGYYVERHQTDPIGPRGGDKKVQRGGSFNKPAYRCPSSARAADSRTSGGFDEGFRVVIGPRLVRPEGDGQPGASRLIPRRAKPQRVSPTPPADQNDGPDDAGPVFSVDLGGETTLELVRIKPGKFIMGTDGGRREEAPAHEVTISRGFYMGRHEVTQEQYEQVMGPHRRRVEGHNMPVCSVFWREANTFCATLSRRTGRHFRLPTEAEWEYAARAGATTVYFFGSEESRLHEYAWCIDNSGKKPHAVGRKKPNPWGLYDIYGNVSEWCFDWYRDGYGSAKRVVDPIGAEYGDRRVRRGGSFRSSPSYGRSACWGSCRNGTTSVSIGFRVVLGPPPRGSYTKCDPPARKPEPRPQRVSPPPAAGGNDKPDVF